MTGEVLPNVFCISLSFTCVLILVFVLELVGEGGISSERKNPVLTGGVCGRTSSYIQKDSSGRKTLEEEVVEILVYGLWFWSPVVLWGEGMGCECTWNRTILCGIEETA